MKITWKRFKQEMIEYAKSIQGKNYPGDDYYTQPCWKEQWRDGVPPEDAVYEDMEYWTA